MANDNNQRKTRVTKKEIQVVRDEMGIKANKRKIVPGPWTEIDPPIEVKAKLRATTGIMGEAYGTYPRQEHAPSCEKGWYTIIFNVTSRSIMRDVEEHGMDNYLAACEKSLNSDKNKSKYGTIVLLKATTDHSMHEEKEHRFVSCYAKTNKKSIKGFMAVRQSIYGIIQ